MAQKGTSMTSQRAIKKATVEKERSPPESDRVSLWASETELGFT